MTYTTTQTKKSTFTTDDDITNSSLFDFIKAGVNKKTTWQNIIDQIAAVYGLGIRLYETESAMVADTNLSLGDHAIVEENRYRLYEVTNVSAGTGDVTLSNGLTATQEGRISPNNFADYTEVRAIDSSTIVDGDIINVTNDGIAGQFVVKTGTVTDNGGTLIVFTDDSNRYAERIDKALITPSMFQASMDGTTDDSTEFNNFLDYIGANSVIADFLNKPMLLTGIKAWAPSVDQHWKNVNIVDGTTYTDQYRLSISTNIELYIENMKLDANRDGKPGLEPYKQFTSFGGVNSIKPTNGSFFKLTYPGRTKDIRIGRLEVTNYHGDTFLEVDNNHAVVLVDDAYFENCTNKTIHIFQGVDGGSQPDLGYTAVLNYVARNIGIMKSTFEVDSITRNRTDNYAPQGAFGLIVTFGRFHVGSAFCQDYGAIAITFDRNRHATFDSIQVEHSDSNAFNNNPSGAVWNEFCNDMVGGSVDIRVSGRDARETALDNSLLQIALSNNQTCIIDKINLQTQPGANMSKTLRGSLTTDSQLFINGGRIEDEDSLFSVRVLNSTGLSRIVSLTDIVTEGASVEISDSQHVHLSNFHTDSTILINSNNEAIDDVNLLDVHSNALTILGSKGDINILGGRTDGTFTVNGLFGAQANRVRIGGGFSVTGVSVIDDAKEVAISSMTTERRIEFLDCVLVSVTGGVYKTDQPEAILFFNPPTPNLMERGSVVGAAIYIKTGTVGAGQITFQPNVLTTADLGNDKATIPWV